MMNRARALHEGINTNGSTSPRLPPTHNPPPVVFFWPTNRIFVMQENVLSINKREPDPERERSVKRGKQRLKKKKQEEELSELEMFQMCKTPFEGETIPGRAGTVDCSRNRCGACRSISHLHFPSSRHVKSPASV